MGLGQSVELHHCGFEDSILSFVSINSLFIDNASMLTVGSMETSGTKEEHLGINRMCLTTSLQLESFSLTRNTPPLTSL